MERPLGSHHPRHRSHLTANKAPHCVGTGYSQKECSPQYHGEVASQPGGCVFNTIIPKLARHQIGTLPQLVHAVNPLYLCTTSWYSESFHSSRNTNCIRPPLAMLMNVCVSPQIRVLDKSAPLRLKIETGFASCN